MWLDVPFVKQSKDGCGASAIAMVMQYWNRQQSIQPGESSDPDHILQILFSNHAHGVYASKMKQYFDANGFRAFTFKGEWTDLNEHIAKGRPLIVALKPSRLAAALHYVVVVGVDPAGDIVIVNDPAQRKLLKQGRTSFEREWNATGQWTLLAVPQSGAH
jgi:predicted double-glycine peptidase